jgi:hypothetical protein
MSLPRPALRVIATDLFYVFQHSPAGIMSQAQAKIYDGCARDAHEASSFASARADRGSGRQGARPLEREISRGPGVAWRAVAAEPATRGGCLGAPMIEAPRNWPRPTSRPSSRPNGEVSHRTAKPPSINTVLRIHLERRLGCNQLKVLARPERFELPTPRFVVWCSIQLSYGRTYVL